MIKEIINFIKDRDNESIIILSIVMVFALLWIYATFILNGGIPINWSPFG